MLRMAQAQYALVERGEAPVAVEVPAGQSVQMRDETFTAPHDISLRVRVGDGGYCVSGTDLAHHRRLDPLCWQRNQDPAVTAGVPLE
jgi:hypothetical protein